MAIESTHLHCLNGKKHHMNTEMKKKNQQKIPVVPNDKKSQNINFQS
jgi:hypothetical protein